MLQAYTALNKCFDIPAAVFRPKPKVDSTLVRLVPGDYHGSVEDEDLLAYLARERIPLEMCPLSNVATEVIRRIEDHPIRKYFDRGLLVTVSTDDPKMFGNSLEQEYRALRQVFGFTPTEIGVVAENSVRASWMDDGGKRRILAAMRAGGDGGETFALDAIPHGPGV